MTSSSVPTRIIGATFAPGNTGSTPRSGLYFPRISDLISIDETALSNGDLYTIISNKDAHGRKGALVAIVSGTRVEDVVAALMKIHWYLRSKVREVTMDFSEGMHQIVLQCFPYAETLHWTVSICSSLCRMRCRNCV